MAFVPTSPEDANRIAAHSVQVLAQMRADTDQDHLNRRYAGWKSWAEQERVCKAIREHMAQAYVEVTAKIRAANRPVIRDPSTGEAA